jgi:lipopolysaccharide transport system ATP-binding protein
MTARVSVHGVSKVFARRHATRTKGVTTEGAAALKYLVRQTLQRPADAGEARRGDRNVFVALDDVSFEVPPGEVLGIIGRNGAGKSTLLKILARVLHPSAGRVAIHGRVVSMLELGVGFAPELTVRQNIEVQGRLAGIAARRIREAEEAILDFAGLAAYRDVPLYECPSGSAVHLGFAAMIGLGADVILADEVLAVGDSAFRHACEQRVRAAATTGESVLFVSHDMAAIRRICTRVAWIDRGRIVQIGETGAVVDAYTAELLAGRLLPPLTADGLAGSCRLLDVRLLDEDHAPVGALQLTKPGYVDCLFRVLRPDVAITVDIELWRERHCVLVSSSRPITARQPTTFRAGIELPADFLNELSYEARFRIRVTSLADTAAQPVVAAEERLAFAALNPHPEESVWRDWPWNRNGLISPRLAWAMSQAPAKEP